MIFCKREMTAPVDSANVNEVMTESKMITFSF